ncbi:MAG: AmmeMemoRadiSam system radical SAM enzyme [Sulfurimonadaceae bacterium]|nr:AmmeMemoRadiSam system radical SAM enzyme [Sulfurimonadaceae bacterium]
MMYANENLYRQKKEGSDAIICQLCQHYCTLKPGKTGICGVNTNEDGRLKNLVYGHPSALHVDPIEKKPLYHVLPASKSLSLGTVGCNFKCSFCQNWQISQSRDIDTSNVVTPEDMVELAQRYDCATIAYTYNEPTIFWPYARDIAVAANAAGIRSIFVSNGLESAEVVDDMKGLIIAANIDLKSFDPVYYKKELKGDLEGVLQTMKRMKANGIWVEVTTLVIEGHNDSDEELGKMARFIAEELGVETPWHLSAFHPDYKMLDTQPTSLETLQRAKGIGEAAGLHYIYVGNVPVEHSTYCPECKERLIERFGFGSGNIHISAEGTCEFCGTTIPGIWR